MFITNATYKTISTEGRAFPIAEGTIISNGIVPQTIAVEPATHRISVAIGGTIDLTSEANKNVSFTAEQIAALGSDFNFIPANEKPEKNELPAVSAADNGDVLAVVNGAWGKSAPPSSLPSYTTSDIGKVLSVVVDTEHREVGTFVPEQQVTLESDDWYGASASLQNVTASLSDFRPGDTCNLSVAFEDSTVYAVVLNWYGAGSGDFIGQASGGISFGVTYVSNGWKVYTNDRDKAGYSATVSATAPMPTAKLAWTTVSSSSTTSQTAPGEVSPDDPGEL